MKKPTLLIMAAGMGSRYGGLKQIAPITDEGEIILDFSLYDAMLASFEKAVIVIRENMREDFVKILGNKSGIDIEFCYQSVNDVPEGVKVPDGREKPWGTGHAILSAKDKIDGAFCVINADDFYGAFAFQVMNDFLESNSSDYSMVSYELKNTISEHGTVARGICDVSEDSFLNHVEEHYEIQRNGEVIESTTSVLDDDTPVSMNFWGFQNEFFDTLEEEYVKFFKNSSPEELGKKEFLLPDVVNYSMREKGKKVKVLRSSDRWYGMTYREDLEDIKGAVQSLKDKGIYPLKLWE